MLGLGDIVSRHYFELFIVTFVSQILPGLLLCFAMRYDHMLVRATMATGQMAITCSRWSYFQISILGYALGNVLS